MKLTFKLLPACALVCLLNSCGGGNGGGNQNAQNVQNANIAGAWQVTVTQPNRSPSPAYAEFNLTQQSNSASLLSANSFLVLYGLSCVINDNVGAAFNPTVTASIHGNSVSLTASYNGGETLLLDGTISGTAMSGFCTLTSTCESGAGSWTAQQMPKASGNYSGDLESNLTSGQTPLSVSIATDSSFHVTGTTLASSACFNSLTLSGSQIGGAVSVTGTDSLGDSVAFTFSSSDPAFNQMDVLNYYVSSGSCMGDSGGGTLTKTGT